MHILVDADACPVKDIILELGTKYKIPVVMFMDTSHIMTNSVCTVITVDKGRDSADIAIANHTKKGDIIVTQDYGLACMLMAKGGHIINQNGLVYTSDNIDSLLMQRHISAKLRKSGKRSSKIKARTNDDNNKFRYNFEKLILSVTGNS